MSLTSKELLCLLICLWKSIKNESLILARHGVQLPSVEVNDVLITVATIVILCIFLEQVKHLLSILCSGIVILSISIIVIVIVISPRIRGVKVSTSCTALL